MREYDEGVSQPLLLTIEQVCKQLGLSRSTVCKLIRKESLPVVRFGRAVRVRSTALQSWLEQREREIVT